MIDLITQNDWEDETISEDMDVLSPVTHQQKSWFIAHCELAQICEFMQSTTLVTQPKITPALVAKHLPDARNELQQDPRILIRSLDAWRTSLTRKMHTSDPYHDDGMYLPEALATSYRYECITCRLLKCRRWGSQDSSWSEWARDRLQLAVFELDAITKKVLVNGSIQRFPMTLYVLYTSRIPMEPFSHTKHPTASLQYQSY